MPHAYNPAVGGVETICKMLSEALQLQGHTVTVLTSNVASVQDYYISVTEVVAPDSELVQGVSVIRVKYVSALWRLALFLWRLSGDRSIIRRLANQLINSVQSRFKHSIKIYISRVHPDIVLALPHLVINVEAVVAAKKILNFPLVMMPLLHEHDPNWESDSVRDALEHADAVVALTRNEASRLVAYYGVAADRLFVIPPGVDSVAGLEELSDADRGQNILYLGRLATTKGLGDLIDAMNRVWDRHPDVTLTLAGAKIPESAQIDALIQSLPASRQACVVQCHDISEQEKSALLRSARCLVLPSRIESFGLVLLEAWAEATPVICWDLPVFSEVVADGVDGLLADAEQGDLSDAILRLLNDADMAKEMGRAGHRKVSTMYRWEQIASQYLEAYEYAIAHAR